MDEARRFRFLIPPFFLALSVSTGFHFSGFDLMGALIALNGEQLVVLGALAGASLLPVGFFITSVSILCLHVLAKLLCWGSHEAVLPPKAWTTLFRSVSTDKDVAREWHLYGSATYDHELLSRGVHEWIQRRWTIFNLSIHSLTAVCLGHVAVLLPMVHESYQWVLFTALFGLVFWWTGVIAWRNTMRMLEFQISRKLQCHAASRMPPQSTAVASTGACEADWSL